MRGGARSRSAPLALLLCSAAAWQRPAARGITPSSRSAARAIDRHGALPRSTALRATDDDDAPTTTTAKPAQSFMDSMQSFFTPKPPTNTSATAQKLKADAEKGDDADVSEEQRRVAEAVVESAFVEASETDDAGRTQTLQKEALDDDVLKAFGIELEGEYKSETLRTISEVAVKAKIALEGAQVRFETELERSKAVVLALVEYAKRKIKYESSRSELGVPRRCLHTMHRLQEWWTWVVSFSILRPFGPRCSAQAPHGGRGRAQGQRVPHGRCAFTK